MPKGGKVLSRKAKRTEIVDYIAAIRSHRAEIRSITLPSEVGEDSPQRSLAHLYGRMLLPRAVEGLDFEAVLYGDAGLVEELEHVESPSVALLQKRGDCVHLTARVPPDFVPALSAAYHDGRLQLCVGRGPPTLRGTSLLINIDFEDREQFESYWGEPLPERRTDATDSGQKTSPAP